LAVRIVINKIKINYNYLKNGQEFVQYWRRYLKSIGDQYTYLLSVGGENLSNIFKTEISFGLLGDIVKALEYHIVDSDVDAVVGILEGLGQTNRFSLSIQFLSSAEKDWIVSHVHLHPYPILLQAVSLL
jgi:hypothetical protein